jgi:hypothetical protein
MVGFWNKAPRPLMIWNTIITIPAKMTHPAELVSCERFQGGPRSIILSA